MTAYIGIDVSKDSLDACLLLGDESRKPEHRIFKNSPSGYEALAAWAGKRSGGAELFFCMESTGCYSTGPASHLASLGLSVSVENPRPIRYFREAANLKSKTDKLDSYCIALYALKMNPRLWHLCDPVLREISQLQTRKRQLLKIQLGERSRLEDRSLPELSRRQILGHIRYLNESMKEAEARIRELTAQSKQAQTVFKAATGLSGVGPECGLAIATMGVESFGSAQQAAAFFGLNPVLRRSGKDAGKTRISKAGDSAGRAAFVYAAGCAARNNSHLKEFFEKLVSRGLKRRQALAAVARKMVMICWAAARNALAGLPVFYPGGEKRGRNLTIYCTVP